MLSLGRTAFCSKSEILFCWCHIQMFLDSFHLVDIDGNADVGALTEVSFNIDIPAYQIGDAMLTHLEMATSPIHCLGGSCVLLTLLFAQIVYSWSSFLYSLAINYQHV